MTARSRGSAAGLALGILLLAHPASPGESPAELPRFAGELEVAIAIREVRVLDERACIASPLRAGDVQLWAGRERLETRLRRGVGPLRVVLLVDASFSMVGRRLDLAVLAARRLLERLQRRRAGDEVAVAVFDEALYWLTSEGFTPDLCAARDELVGLDVGRATALWQALDAVLDLSEAQRSARPTVVVVASDGQDTEDRRGELAARVVARARELDIALFAVAIPPIHGVLVADDATGRDDDVRCRRGEWLPGWLDERSRRLLEACAATGGAMYTPRRSRVREAVDFVYSQLLDRHEIEAEIPAPLLGHEIRVAPGRAGLFVLAGRDAPPARAASPRAR